MYLYKGGSAGTVQKLHSTEVARRIVHLANFSRWELQDVALASNPLQPQACIDESPLCVPGEACLWHVFRGKMMRLWSSGICSAPVGQGRLDLE